jgi:ABC-type transport system substrate-binding protein
MMKRIFWIVLGAALVGPGCFTAPVQQPEQAKPLLPPKPPPAPPPPAVTADGITSANAWDRANAMTQELNYASKGSSRDQ